MPKRIKLKYPVIVEGRYDKAALASIFDAVIITTGGFSVFNSKEKQSVIKRLCSSGVILLTDSDGGGKQIRTYLHSILPRDAVHDAYIPKIAGKEPRKKAPSRAGFIGVEGVGRELLEKALSPYVASDNYAANTQKQRKMITKVDFFMDGLSGGNGSCAKRAEILRMLDLPDDMTANAMLEALNMLIEYDKYKELVKAVKQ